MSASGHTLTRLAALVTLLGGALALGFAGLVGPPVCLLTLALIAAVGVLVPRRFPGLLTDPSRRTVAALTAMALLVAGTALSGPGALYSGELTGGLGAAAAELALPSGVPIGLLAALAAGALVAVSLELGDRRGVQSALVLSIAVLGLAAVAAPGAHLLPAVVPGWPAAMLALTRLAGTPSTGTPSTGTPSTGPVTRAAGPEVMRRIGDSGRARTVGRWQVLPVLAAITVGLAGLALAVAGGVASLGERSGGWNPAAGAGGGSGSRSTSDYLGGDMDLTARGPLRQDPLLEVTTGSPGLWRAATVDQYNGRGWATTPAPAGVPALVSVTRGAVRLSPAPANSGSARTDQVRQLRAGAAQVLAPGQLVGFQLTPPGTGARAFAAGGDRVALAGGAGGALRYEVRSVLLPRVDDPTATAVLADPADPADGAVSGPLPDGALDPRWRALPPTVPERVGRLGRALVTGAPSRLAAVRAIEAELARRMTYTLDSPVPPPGADAVDDVLFVSHSGFCEQFATAEVVLLRSAGVPARLVVGFSGGEPGDGGFRTLRRSDAHAWVEVWFDGIGWVTSDPTPPGTAARSWWQPVRDALRSAAGEPVLRVVLIAGPVVAVVAVLGLRRRRPGRHPLAAGTGRRPDPELAAAFARLEARLRAESRPRAPNETVAALARRLSIPSTGTRPTLQPPDAVHPDAVHPDAVHPDAVHPVVQPLVQSEPDLSLAEALQIWERDLYAGPRPSRADCRRAAAALDRYPYLRPGSHRTRPAPRPGPRSGR